MADSDLITLRSDVLELGVVPAVGGRIVRLLQPGGANVLFAPEEIWSNWRTNRPDPEVYPFWQPYHGHITWLGPQAGFWDQQDQFPDKRGDNWPPDPFQIYGDFSVRSQDERSVELEGPPSPVSGLQLGKRIEISGHRASLTVTAINRRDTAVAWDLWSNTRMRPEVPFFVPVAGPEHLTVGYRDGPPLPWRTANGVVTLSAGDRAPGAKSKAFIAAREPWIAALHPDALFLKEFEAVPTAHIHPDHALVEIYLDVPDAAGSGLLELEFHGPFTHLQPGGSMTQTERWTLWPRDSHEAADWLRDNPGVVES